ncbi:MAG: PCMD domain-containing protein [Alistipes sp.]|nr:PCMD domain-containing protein [Alistipes sp.]
MKKILYIVTCLALILGVACSKDDDYASDEKGAVSFLFPITRATVDEATYQMMKFRIYSYDEAGEKTLVRLYTYDEIKDMKMWLVAGAYSIDVEGGVKAAASFTDIYYAGSTKFDLAAGEDKSVTVKVHPKNTLIKVVFDNSVSKNMEKAQAIVAVADEFNIDDIAKDEVPSLIYNQTAVGYYLLEEDAKSFVWNFTGKVPAKGDSVDKIGKYTPAEGFKPGYQYTITFKYSADLPGYISLNVNVDKTETVHNNELVFKPEPQIVGESSARVYEGMEALTYDVKAISELATMKITVGDEVYTYSTAADVTNTNEGYFTVEQVNEGSNLNWTVTLADGLINKLKAGNQTVVLTAIDSDDVEGEIDVNYFGEGTFAMSVVDAWTTTATLKAYVNNSAASDVKIYYREVAPTLFSDWSVAEATLLSDNIYAATVTGVDGNRNYEFYLYYGEKQKGVNATFTTKGKLIPHGELEVWSGSMPLCPSEFTSKNQSLTWDTGNHGSETVGTNVTTNSTDVRPGSTGKYSACLKSTYAAFLGIGKFAAGNIFYGRYVNTEQTTNGIIDFGQPFSFDYKPKKLTVWYKGTIGTVDYAGGSVSNGDSDKAQIYVWLYDNTDAALASTGGRYKVRTYYPGTFVTPDGKYVNEGDAGSTSHKAGDRVEGLVAYGYWNRTQSETQLNGTVVSMEYNGWTKLEIPLVYVDESKRPNAVVISCAASAYGDYFAGSTSSVMYVDDFEFEY